MFFWTYKCSSEVKKQRFSVSDDFPKCGRLTRPWKCERSRPGLSQLGCWHAWQRTPIQDGNHSGNDPRLVPGFLHQCAGMFRDGSGECPYLWVQQKFVQFGQGTRNAELYPAEFLGQVFAKSALNLFRNVCYIFLSDSRSRCVLPLAVPKTLLCFS